MPETEYTTTPDGGHIAFQASGSGPPDIVLLRGTVSHLEIGLQMASFAPRMAPCGSEEVRPLAMTFTPVRDPERQRALDVLVTAFTADPVIRWMYPEAHRYLTHFPSFLMAFGGKAFNANSVWRLGDFSAVALWFPPHVEPDGDAVVAVITQSVAPEQQEDLLAVIGQMDGAHPQFPHWYLPWFGVDGGQQGKGLGGLLMKQCLAIVDGDHLPAYLESPNPRNISFYERHGFEVTGVSQAGGCPPVYSMLRAAR